MGTSDGDADADADAPAPSVIGTATPPSGERAVGGGRAAGGLVGGRYRLDGPLGEGGMGVVWAARHTVTGERVALKLLKGDLISSSVRRRFVREARAASAVSHPNVVRVRDVFEDGDTPVLVMDLLEGESLASRLRRGPLTVIELAEVLMPVLSAVAAAHAAGIIHRDLKPDNIFLVAAEPSGAREVRVLDFGIAKLTADNGEAATSGQLTSTGDVLGTPHYMAPEQCYGESDIDARADVWALGVVIHECLSGRRPFAGGNVGQVWKRVTQGDRLRLQEVAPDAPRELCELVDRMLSVKREARPSGLLELSELLARYSAPSLPAAISSGAPRRITRPIRSLVAVGAALVVAGSAIAVTRSMRATNSTPAASPAPSLPPPVVEAVTGAPGRPAPAAVAPAVAPAAINSPPRSATPVMVPPAATASKRRLAPRAAAPAQSERTAVVHPAATHDTPVTPSKLPGHIVEGAPF